LGLFANQINLFEKFANDKTQQNNFYAMSLENSVNCLNVMMQLKEKIINNENN